MYEIFFTDCEGKLTVLKEPQDGCWINMLDPTAEEIDLISGLVHAERDFITAALDEEERPRIESEDDCTLVLTDIPVVESTAESSYNFMYSTMPMGIVVCKECVITVCLKKTQLIKDFLDNRVKTFATFKKNRFLLQLMYRNATYYLQYLRQIDKISNNIENDLHKSMKNKELILLLSLEKSLVYFSTSLKSNEIVLEKMLKYNYENISIRKYPDDEDLLEDVIIENKQAIEMANIYSNILSGTMDAFASIISNNLNIVMKLLASVTIIISLPTLVTGAFGMNVEGIPFAGHPLGFWIVMGIALGISVVSGIVMWRKKMF